MHQVVIRAAFEGRVVDRNAFEPLQKFSQLQGVATKTFHAQAERFEAKCVQERGVRSYAAAHVAPNAVAKLCDVGEFAKALVFFKAFKTRVIPVEFAAVNDNAANGAAIAVDVLGRRMYNDICAKIKGMYKVRGGRGAVDNERDASLMRHVCDTLQIDHV